MHSRSLGTARSQLLAERARQMRAQPTLSEAKLWAALEGGRLGVAFRRQVVIGELIVDFLAPRCRLIVEIDGGYHVRRARADARRDRELEARGYRVLRLSAELVMRSLPEALARVTRALGG